MLWLFQWLGLGWPSSALILFANGLSGLDALNKTRIHGRTVHICSAGDHLFKISKHILPSLSTLG